MLFTKLCCIWICQTDMFFCAISFAGNPEFAKKIPFIKPKLKAQHFQFCLFQLPECQYLNFNKQNKIQNKDETSQWKYIQKTSSNGPKFRRKLVWLLSRSSVETFGGVRRNEYLIDQKNITSQTLWNCGLQTQHFSWSFNWVMNFIRIEPFVLKSLLLIV